ncbi:MAG: xanthine dehydrogenase family protein molybdopterin-binding subunit [Deltaproteobacteria bacterium]|nr:xanthine dehydrogenase family protein molybdopterin-binding subunit [Deltaproteobacteria bacterium]
MKSMQFTRRQFLKSTGALVVSFNLLPPAGKVFAQFAKLPSGDIDPTSLDSWLVITPDGYVTFYTSKVEIGTGTITALAQFVAEELDVAFNKIKMDSGDTEKTIEQGSTVGSRSIERAGPQIRQAAAAARHELFKLASAQLGAPVEKLTVADGVVSVVGEPSKRVTYGQLIGGKKFNTKLSVKGTGWDMVVAPEVKAKNPKDYKVVGQSIQRVELPRKVTGEHDYIHDVRLPGMLHGRVVRPPAINTDPESIDQDSIKGIPGVVMIAREGKFVGVVAKTEWAAIKAARALKVTWAKPTSKVPGTADEVYTYLKNTKPVRSLKPVDKGSATKALAEARKVYQSSYRFPFQMHGMIRPSCSIADVKGNKATIWSGPQGPFRTRSTVAAILGLKDQDVRIIYHEASGSYGRMSTDDGAEDAAILSRAVGAPVRVQWSRQDEHGWEPKGPAQVDEIKAAVDSDGKITAWEFADYGQPWTASGSTPLLASLQVGLRPTNPGGSNGTQSSGEFYTIANHLINIHHINWHFPEPIPLRTSNLRAPGDVARCFASEGFIDEIAADLKVDPVEFRLKNLTGNKRAIECLQAAADKAGWQKRPSPAPAQSGNIAKGRGVALTNRAQTYVAIVAEVEVNKTTGQVAVKKLVCSHDCGLIVNPDGVKNQVEGNVIQGVSRAMYEEVLFDKDSSVTSLDWATYPILRFTELPEFELVLINRPEMNPLGAGEGATIPPAAAIANAIYDAVGARLKEGPFTPKRVLAAMQKKA